jgi:AcrR family transcriptional regulator
MALAEPVDQRARILDTALRLMAEGGVHAMSMRRLANDLGINVATIYYYFPSKADLLRAVVAHQNYAILLAQVPPIDATLTPAERLSHLLRWIWSEMGTQDDMWRLLLGESLRGDGDVMGSAAELSALFEDTLIRWLDELVPELPDDTTVVARVLRGCVYGFFVEYLPLPRADRDPFFRKRADEMARVFMAAASAA